MGRYTHSIHWSILIPALLLLCLGLVTLLSLSPTYFYQQLVTGIVGLILFMILSRIDFSIYAYLDKLIYVVSVSLLALTFLGPDVRGSTRWLEVGGIAIQTSEILKPFFLLAIASFLVRFPPITFKTILLHIGLFLAPFFLIFTQPDLGNAIVYTTIWVAMVILAGIPLFFIVVALIVNLALLPLGYNFLRDYQKLRIQTFLNPFLDPKGAGYNAIQAMIAVGSGKLVGRGFGRGTQTILQFLPEYHTDFIFAAYAEEFGFLGGLILLLLFYLLLWQIVKQARMIQENKFAFLYAGGFFMYIITQIIVNIGMNMGLVPITGITLPLVSYGGSSLLSLWIGLGILVAALNTRSKAKLL